MPVRSVKITADTVISTAGGTFHGIIWYGGGALTPNAYIDVFDDDTTTSPSPQIARIHTSAAPPDGDDKRGFEIVCKVGITVKANNWSGLEVYVLYN